MLQRANCLNPHVPHSSNVIMRQSCCVQKNLVSQYDIFAFFLEWRISSFRFPQQNCDKLLFAKAWCHINLSILESFCGFRYEPLSVHHHYLQILKHHINVISDQRRIFFLFLPYFLYFAIFWQQCLLFFFHNHPDLNSGGHCLLSHLNNLDDF